MSTNATSTATTSGLEGPAVSQGEAFVTELFSGIQGEGPYVGVRQIFVRFGGCDLRCSWCDTPRSLVRRDPARIEKTPGLRDFETLQNPLTLGVVTKLLDRLEPGAHHSVSLTGGEPLLQFEAIPLLAGLIHRRGSLAYLETHGARVHELTEVIECIDIVSMDIKLRSSTGEHIDLRIHQEFLAVAAQRDVFVKVVVTPGTEESEVLDALRIVNEVSPEITFVLQPVTPFGQIKESPSPNQMLRLQDMALKIHRDVRVIPQTHHLIGQL